MHFENMCSYSSDAQIMLLLKYTDVNSAFSCASLYTVLNSVDTHMMSKAEAY